MKPQTKRVRHRVIPLPKVKVTQYQRNGLKKTRILTLRNSQHIPSSKTSHATGAEPFNSVTFDPPAVSSTGDSSDHASAHAQRRQSSRSSWDNLHQQLLHAHLSQHAPSSNVCTQCEAPSTMKCSDCLVEVCEECAVDKHLQFLHAVLEWQDGMYRKVVRMVKLKPLHVCQSSSHRDITLVSHRGNFFSATVPHCCCEPLAITLVRHGFWPATPDCPTLAVSVQLLDFMHHLLLESQMPAYSFVSALKFQNQLSVTETSKLQRFMKEQAISQFRRLHADLKSIGRDELPVLCPACPKENGQRTVAIDGNFGLVLKNKSTPYSEQQVECKLVDRFFLPQKSVDEYVLKSASDSKSGEGECSRFQAGDVVRSKNKANGLRYTGVMGSICKHDIPLVFMNLLHGERLAYPLYLLDTLNKQIQGKNITLNIIYDISCVLVRHLKKHKRHDLLEMNYAIPVFHCYGHQASCQYNYSPRRKSGFGLMDGEQMERFWSYLRRFSLITKEQTEAHRSVVLSLAMSHFAEKKIGMLDLTLSEKLQAAERIYQQSTQQLLSLLDSLPMAVSRDDISNWNAEEMRTMSDQTVLKAIQGGSTWQQSYVADLQSFYTMMRSNNREVRKTADVLDRKLKAIESQHKMTRWTEGDRDFQQHLLVRNDVQKMAMLLKLRSLVEEKSFLQQIKSRYSEGQAIAGRVTKQVQKVATQITRYVHQYNGKQFSPGALPQNLSQADVASADAPVFEILTSQIYQYGVHDITRSGTTIPVSIKRQLVDLLNLITRSQEEMIDVRASMSNYLQYLSSEFEAFDGAARSAVSDGEKAFIHVRAVTSQAMYNRAYTLFSSHISLPDMLGEESSVTGTLRAGDVEEMLAEEAQEDEILNDEFDLASLTSSQVQDIQNIGLNLL